MMYSCKITFLWLFFLLFSCKDNRVERSIEIQKRRLQIAQGMPKRGKTISDVCLTKMTNGINISTKNDDKLIQIKLFHWSPETAQVVYDWEIINNDTLLTYHVANITLGTVPKGYRELEKFGDVLVDRKNYCISYENIQWICELGGSKGKITRFFLLKGLEIIMHAQELKHLKKKIISQTNNIKAFYNLLRNEKNLRSFQ